MKYINDDSFDEDLDDLSPKERKSLMSTVKNIYTQWVSDLYNEGKIKESDLNDKVLLKKKLGKYLGASYWDIALTVDHRDEILKLAKIQFTNGTYGIGVTLYATYVEHTLNSFIQIACWRMKIKQSTITEIIQNSNIYSKYNWMLELLRLPAIPQHHRKTIKLLSDERNGYVHYKWKPTSTDHDSKEDDNREKFLKEIKLLLKYLKSYETRIRYSGKKGKITRTIKSSLPAKS